MNMKRLAALLLIATLTAGNCAAVAVEDITVQQAENTSSSIRNPNPKILSLKAYTNSQGGRRSVRVQTNWLADPEDASTESALLYRTEKGKTRVLRPSRSFHIYELKRDEYGNDFLTIYDMTAKNGTFYEYQFATTNYDGVTGENYPVVYSNTMSIYYLSSIRRDELSIKNSSNGKTMTISWPCNSKADGYQIQYATKEDLSNRITRKVTKNNQTSLKLSNRTPGKQYWVRMRSYKKYKGKTWYSAWSTVNLRYPE